MSNKQYLLALSHMPKIGARTIKKLYRRWPKLHELFSLKTQDLEAAGIKLSLAETLTSFDWQESVDNALAWELESNNHIISWEDNAYPALLKEISDPPPIIYAKGNLACLQEPTLAIVGTRIPSYVGKETAYRFAKELSDLNLTIVSGLAKGIDGCAHQACIDSKGKTIAVMGTGIDIIYPFSHRALAAKIAEKGLVLTEFPLKTSAKAGHFPLRNRIISGLSLATLVVEASIRSGSLITARLALEQNREVFAIPGSIYNPQTKGCHYLLQQGAKLVTSVQDILEDLGMISNYLFADSEKIPLANSEENLVKCIGFEISTIDDLLKRTGQSVEQVLCGLAKLELLGVVKSVPGGYVRSP